MASEAERPAKRPRIDDTTVSSKSDLFSESETTEASAIENNDNDETIAVLVGEEQTRFTVSKNLLAASSAFFRAALRGDFKEAQERKVKLPEAKAETFEAYRRWLQEDFIDSQGTPETTKDGLFHLYVLADQLQDLRLCNRISDLCISLWWDEDNMYPCDLNNFYPFTLAGCKLRSLAVDCLVDIEHGHCIGCPLISCCRRRCMQHPAVEAGCSQRDWLEEHKDNLPFDFVLEVAKVSIAQAHKKRVEPRDRGRCYYHMHNEEVPECE